MRGGHLPVIERVIGLHWMRRGDIQPEHGRVWVCELRRRLLPAVLVDGGLLHVHSWDVLGIWDGIMLELRGGNVLGADWGDTVLELLGR